jgi:hypothetical protein
MKFNNHGYLEAGIHPATVEEIEEHLVKAFPTSTTRAEIATGYKQHRAELEKLGIQVEQLLDGSFISTKNDPSDVDMVCFADAASIDALPPHQQLALRLLVISSFSKPTYRCDAYFCPSVPVGHPDYETCRTSKKYWLGEFGYDRHEVPKGILQLFIPMGAGSSP